MRLSVSEACNDVLVTKMAPVAAKSESKPVIFIFIMLLFSIFAVFVFNIPATLSDAPILRHGVLPYGVLPCLE